MSDDILNYRFIVPITRAAEEFFNKFYKDKKQSSDGSPFCKIDEGYLFTRDEVDILDNGEKYKIFEISDRFVDKDDFITAFWDGDVEDEDFILVEIKES